MTDAVSQHWYSLTAEMQRLIICAQHSSPRTVYDAKCVITASHSVEATANAVTQRDNAVRRFANEFDDKST